MPNATEVFIKSFIKKIRDYVSSERLSIQRLPRWVNSAHIRYATLGKSTIFVFDALPSQGDSISFCGAVWSDLQFLLERSEYIPTSAVFRSPTAQKIILVSGEYGPNKSVVWNIEGIYPALYNAGYVYYHSPIGLVNIFLQLSPLGEVSAVRFIPFALYVHDKDIKSFDTFWSKCVPFLQDVLRGIHDSATGDYYQSMKGLATSILMSKERSVIVFGKYGDSELKELTQVRDYLKKSYDAYLLKDLPSAPSMSLEEKVKLWSSASRFCVMIDYLPSGHLVEYPYLKTSRAVLALLRLKGKKSTAMIEDNTVDFPFIKTFEFGDSPLEAIGVAIEWAEEFIEKRVREKSD